eukprot:TRINITY_DN73714_c0_g1_i1.p1 TRINITY_DN73714_c0_g1~~TRINITY_DN73714_c0_g1_i1.p1  ORF type:complete len:591 (-),score=68.57 TRINITY_DN73714_c0_g1_i1:189-1871(-)
MIEHDIAVGESVAYIQAQSDGMFHCGCGYTCGTHRALAKHLARQKCANEKVTELPEKTDDACIDRSAAKLAKPAKLAELAPFLRFEDHVAASKRFSEMLLQMRHDLADCTRLWKQMRRLFSCGPVEARSRAAKSGVLVEMPALLEIADDRFFNFDVLSDHVVQTCDEAKTSSVSSQYNLLENAIEAEVLAANSVSRSRDVIPLMVDLMQLLKWNNNTRIMSPGELFVHLPLTMYVQNTLHLYQMLGRLNSATARGKPGLDAGETRQTAPSKPIKHILDEDGLPYSYLVFAIMASLQIIYRVRRKNMRLQASNVLALLASNPRPVNKFDRLPPAASSDNELMFRGLWVPTRIDEERARFQYSFTSWSRTLEGVLFVLDFYANVLPLAQRHDWHILLLVSKKWQDNPWVVPVQMFAGSRVGEAEKELLLPPFMAFEFEEDLELSSKMRFTELHSRSELLIKRWQLVNSSQDSCADASETQSLSLLQAVSRKLPALLMRSPNVFRQCTMENFKNHQRFPVPRQPPHVTVRFVSSMEPRGPVRELFENTDDMLFAFPQASEAIK